LINDFRDMLFALCDEKVEFMVVGAYALSFHGMPRATGDIDILVRPSPENAKRVWRSLLRFGAPLSGMTEADFTNPDVVFQMGRQPARIDILTDVSGVDFDTAWKSHVIIEYEGRSIPVMGIGELLITKRAAGRPKDMGDIAWLEKKLKKAR
jgi:hypothetical protein